MERFDHGQIVMTHGISDRMIEDEVFVQFILTSLQRHMDCDWGDMAAEDMGMNDAAVKSGEDRIFSAYKITPDSDAKIWIITEADRSATTVLFPSEY